MVDVSVDRKSLIFQALLLFVNHVNQEIKNPHCIVFVDDINNVELEKIGPKFETNPVFPKKTNTEFVEVKNDKYVRMRVWERGAGITWLVVLVLALH